MAVLHAKISSFAPVHGGKMMRSSSNVAKLRWVYGLACFLQIGNLAESLPVFKPVFGPVSLTCTDAGSRVFRLTFDAPEVRASFRLMVQNGLSKDGPPHPRMPALRTKIPILQFRAAVLSLNGKSLIEKQEFENAWEQEKSHTVRRKIKLLDKNVLEGVIEGDVGSIMTLTVIPAADHISAVNPMRDLWGGYDSKLGIMLYCDQDPRMVKFLIFKKSANQGEWQQVAEITRPPEFRGRGGPIFWDRNFKETREDVQFRVEAYDQDGQMIRNYEPINIPRSESNDRLEILPNVIDPVVTTFILSQPQEYDTAWFTDRQLTTDDPNWGWLDIKFFLCFYGSFLCNDNFVDIDGFVYDPAEVIELASTTQGINPQAIMVMMEKEQSAIRFMPNRPPDNVLRKIMGWNPPTFSPTMFDQIQDGTAQLRRDLNRLDNLQPTAGGWQVGVSHAVTDSSSLVTPATKAVACLFSYNPELGSGWGGSSPGGNYLFKVLWYESFADWGFTTPTVSQGTGPGGPGAGHQLPRGCLAAGTRVETSSGWMLIDQVRPGDRVIGWNGNSKIPTEISKVYAHEGQWTLREIKGNWLTPDHEVWHQEKWVHAAEISRSSARSYIGRVYDLTTATGNFFIGEDVLVHNKSQPPAKGIGFSRAGEEFVLGQAYSFPNPAKGVNPTLHFEAGLADEVTFTLYTVAGEKVGERIITGRQVINVDGKLAYEISWPIGELGSGVYLAGMKAAKSGHPVIIKTIKLAVVK